MDQRLLNILACPMCKGALQWDRKNEQLICKYDHIAYPIRNNVPIMLVEEATKFSIE